MTFLGKIQKAKKIIKLDFTELDVWRYLAIHHPPNPLYKKGYRSIDCKILHSERKR